MAGRARTLTPAWPPKRATQHRRERHLAGLVRRPACSPRRVNDSNRTHHSRRAHGRSLPAPGPRRCGVNPAHHVRVDVLRSSLTRQNCWRRDANGGVSQPPPLPRLPVRNARAAPRGLGAMAPLAGGPWHESSAGTGRGIGAVRAGGEMRFEAGAIASVRAPSR